MVNPTIQAWVVKEHQDHLLEEVKKSRTLKATWAEPRPWEYILARVGDMLVSVGTRLQEQYEPVRCADPEVCQV